MKIILSIVLLLINIPLLSVSGQDRVDVIYMSNGNILKGVIVEDVPNEYVKIELEKELVYTVKYSDVIKFAKEKKTDYSQYNQSGNIYHEVNRADISTTNNLFHVMPDNNYMGACLGLSFLGSAVQFGGNFEHILELENIGTAGIGGIIRYWSYSENYFASGNVNGEWSYVNFLIGVQGNYHFKVISNNIDPWIGLVLAYDAGSVDWSGSRAYVTEPDYGGVFLGIHGGIRYFLSPVLALTGRIGFGTLSYGGLEAGVDFKL